MKGGVKCRERGTNENDRIEMDDREEEGNNEMSVCVSEVFPQTRCLLATEGWMVDDNASQPTKGYRRSADSKWAAANGSEPAGLTVRPCRQWRSLDAFNKTG